MVRDKSVQLLESVNAMRVRDKCNAFRDEGWSESVGGRQVIPFFWAVERVMLSSNLLAGD